MTTPDPEREPCPHCAEPAALRAKICPHCRGSLLADIALDRPVLDPRARYQLARSLARLGAPFLELQKSLARPGTVVLRGLSRADARAALEMLSGAGAAGRIVAAGARARAASSPPALLLYATVAIAAIGLAGGAAIWLSRPADTPAPASSGAEPAEPAETGRITTADIAERAGPSIVALSCAESVGTGFFVTSDRLLTNAHVLCPPGETLTVHMTDGREIRGRVVRRDDEIDLAMVEAPGAGASPLPLGDVGKVRVGDRIVVIGTPLGMAQTVHEGTVSHAGRQFFGVLYMQIDANVNPGNSGGPVLDEGGRVVGIVTLKVDGASGLGFAVPVNYAYEGPGPFLPPPADLSPGWKAMLAKAKRQEEEEVNEVRRTLHDAALVLAMTDGRALFGLFMKRFATGAARPESVTYAVEKDGMPLCSGAMTIERWVAMTEAPEGAFPARQVQWLEKHGLAADVYLGWGQVPVGRCSYDPSRLVGAQLVLEGRTGEASRTTILTRQSLEASR